MIIKFTLFLPISIINILLIKDYNEEFLFKNEKLASLNATIYN